MVDLHVERTIAAPREKVFEWLADPESLLAVRLVVKSGWTKAAPGPRVGAVREVAGVGIWFREEITAYDAPASYSYLILRSFPAFTHDGGTLTFTPRGDATHVDWDTRYTHSTLAGGKAMEAVSSRLLTWAFNDVLAGAARRLET